MKFFKYLLFSCAFIFVNPAHAAWAGMTNQELLSQSDVIIKATYMGETFVRFPGMAKPSLLGILKVEKVYKGELPDVVLLSLPIRSPNVSVSTDILHTVGQNGIWFLRSEDGSEGIYLADHPQRIWPINQQDKLNQLLGSISQ